MIDPNTMLPVSVWAPYAKVEYERVGRLIKAEVSDLNPNTMYEFRVFTVDTNGRSSEPSTPFGTMTTRTMDWTYIYIGMAFVLLGLLAIAIIKDRRGEVYQPEYV